MSARWLTAKGNDEERTFRVSRIESVKFTMHPRFPSVKVFTIGSDQHYPLEGDIALDFMKQWRELHKAPTGVDAVETVCRGNG